MRTRALVYGMLASATLALGTEIETPERTIEELVREADHVVVGKVLSVTMRRRDGSEVRNVNAKTGPGSGHVITIRIGVGKSDVLETSATEFPGELTYDLWESLILDLASMKELEGRTFVILFEGARFRPHGVAPLDFMWPIEWRDRIVNVIAAERRKPNKSPEPTPGIVTPAASSSAKPSKDQSAPGAPPPSAAQL